jgi:peptide/nickel transport system ATP-binding protein
MSGHLLTVTELTVTHPGAKRPELDRLSLAVDAGETLVILGEAGCGKEALMRVLAGAAERDEIVDGTLQFGTASPERAVKFPKPAIRMSYLPGPFEQPLNQHVSALSQLTRIVARKLDAPRASAQEELGLALGRLSGAPKLTDLDKPPAELSPEMQAWGLFAAAYAQNPELLLADHALAGLAPGHARALTRALLAEQTRLGFAILYAAMNAETPVWLKGRLIVMRHGKIVEEGPAERLATSQAHSYTQTLFKARPPALNEKPQARASTRGQPVIQAYRLEMAKPSPKRARDDLTFELRRGASLALIGDEGSGRHTLARILLGLDRAPAGRVVFDAVDIGVLAKNMMARLRRRVAFVAGADDMLDPRMTIWDTVAEPLRTHLDLPRHVIASYRDVALKRVGLASLPGNRVVASLSAFDKRRLQVARAIVSAPVLAVIDEPLRGLDAFAQAVMRDLLKNFRTQEGPAFLVITSDITVALALAEDAMIMKDSRVIERGPLADILRAPKTVYTASLIEASAPVKNSALPPAVPQG